MASTDLLPAKNLILVRMNEFAHRRCWYRFKLRTLFALTAAVAVLMGLAANRLIKLRQQRAVIEKVVRTGCTAQFGHYPGQEGRPASEILQIFIAENAIPSLGHLLRTLNDASGNWNVWIVVEHKTNWPAVPGTSLTEFAQLSGLGRFQLLDCHKTKVRNLKPLAELKGLEMLYVSGTLVNDLSPLAGLPNLRSVLASDTEVGDLTPLANLLNLESLDVEQTKIVDLMSLASLKKLTSLNVGYTGVSDITPLAGLSNLWHLDIGKTEICNIAALAALKDLVRLDISYTRITDLTPLSELKKLVRLDISGTKAADLTPLRNLTSLEWLHINDTEFGVEQINDLRKALPRCQIDEGP